MNRVSSFLLLIGGILLCLGGLAGVGMGVIAILDPIGTKMADDADPFGAPPSALASIFITISFALVVAVGFGMIWFADRTSSKNR